MPGTRPRGMGSGIWGTQKDVCRPTKGSMSGGAIGTARMSAGGRRATFDALSKEFGIAAPQLWEGTKGGNQTAVRELDLEVRPFLDELITEQAVGYIKRAAAADK